HGQQGQASWNRTASPDYACLEVQRLAQDTVERRGGHPQVEARLGGGWLEALQPPQENRYRQQQEVEVRGALELPAGLAGRGEQGAAVVAPVVVVDLVMAAPQPLVGGNRNQQSSARLGHATQLVQGAHVVFQVLDHVEADGQIEGAVVEGGVHDRALEHFAGLALASEPDACARQLHARDDAVVGKLHHVAPAAAAGIENACLRRQSQARNRLLQYATATLVPPVAVLGAVRLQLVLQLHSRASFTNGRRRAARPPFSD